jgi:hypothetical protein
MRGTRQTAMPLHPLRASPPALAQSVQAALASIDNNAADNRKAERHEAAYLHRGHYAVFAEQDGPAEQRAVGLLFGRNKDSRARLDVALVGGN